MPPVELFIKAKAAFEANRAAKEETKLRMKQRHALAKEGEPFINLLIYFSIPFNLFSQPRLPFHPPVVLFSPAIFKFGDLVQIIPDKAPGVHSCHSVAFTGRIIELKCYGGWLYNIFVRYMCVQVLLPGPHVGGPQSTIIAGRGKIICAIVLKSVFPLL